MTVRPGFSFDEQNLTRQQEILTVLGFYYGKIEGRWGPLSQQAMSKFEKDIRFKPGIPNHGMPLDTENLGRIPSILEVKDGMLYTPLLEDLWKKAQPKPVEPKVEEPSTEVQTPVSVEASGKKGK